MKLPFLGLASGFLSAFFGIGGGVVTVPALTIFWRFPVKGAIGTSLAVILPVAVVGVATEFLVRRENLRGEAAAALAAGAVAGTFLGRAVFARLAEGTLRWVYAFFLLLVAMRLAGMFGLIAAPPLVLEGEKAAVWSLCAGIGLLAGASSTLFGIGGGVLAVPLLILLFREFQFHGARATALAMIVPSAAVGIWHHRKLGTVDLPTARRLILPACAGAVAGVFVVQQVPSETLKMLFSILLVFTAWRILRK